MLRVAEGPTLVANFEACTIFNSIFYLAFSTGLRPKVSKLVGAADFSRHEVVDYIAAPVVAEIFDIDLVLELR